MVITHAFTLREIYKALNEKLELLQGTDELHHEGLSRMYHYPGPDTRVRAANSIGFVQLGDNVKLEDLCYRWLAVYPVEGASEGHYIHVDLIWDEQYGGRHVASLFLLKTFAGKDAAITLASTIARELPI